MRCAAHNIYLLQAPKRFIHHIFFYCIFVLPAAAQAQDIVTIDLHTGWEFRKCGDTSGWMPATVPGCVHTDLIANQIIPDPFYADNEKLVQWVENEDWEYRTTFNVNRKLLHNDHIELNFEGLDTYADVYLNDSLILQADNMFRTWSVDIKNILHRSENKLYIRFYSAVKKGKELMAQHPVKLPGDERVFTRKAQYQYGWDWGPRLVTSGIWKGVNLTFKNYDAWQPSRVDIFPAYVSKDSALLAVKYNEGYFKSGKYHLTIRNEKTNEILYQKKIHLAFTDPIIPDIVDYIKIKDPALWWCNGMGSPELYHLSITVTSKGRTVYTTSKTIGIKTLELIQGNNTGAGSSFYFKLNGVPVFCKGANYIPVMSFPSSATQKTYRELLIEAQQMHMNMIRIWGGGTYVDEAVYALCDSLGIMVWQDFMFACGMYPSFDDYNVDIEVHEQISRIKDHPSLALLCGNNEISEGWFNWGWQRQYGYSASDSAAIWKNYLTVFDTIIPSKITNTENRRKYTYWFPLPEFRSIYAPGIGLNYHPSSPTFGWGRAESLTHGDCHYWGVWWGKEPFETYNKKIPRFMSEYGFQGMPSFNSFKQFIPADELTGSAQEILNTAAVKNHQKHPVGDETIREYMERDYQVPENFEDYIYVSQLLQAEGMRTAIEAHRRNMPYCMGTLFWQLNDCWPVTSWSVIDYYGNRKAAYYTVKEKYEDVLLSTVMENDTLRIYAVNEKIAMMEMTLHVHLNKTSGGFISATTEILNLLPQSSSIIYEKPLRELIGQEDTADLYLHAFASSKETDSIIAESFYYFAAPKNLELPEPIFNMTLLHKEHKIYISSSNLIKNLYLYTETGELKLSDNFFDLTPGNPRVVTFEGDLNPITNPLQYKCLNTIGGN